MFTLDVYKDQKAPAYALLFVTIQKYGTECFEWEPEFLRHQIEQDYNIVLSTLQHDKLHAAIVVYTTDQFENDWRVFETCCHLFNNELVDHEDINPIEVEDIPVGISEAGFIKKDSDEALVYDDEIRAYVGLAFYEYGMHNPPDLFPTAIMKSSVKKEGDDREKNAALKEIYDAHVQYILNYLEKIE